MAARRADAYTLARSANESASTGPSAWARRLLEKQGWSDGKGLGKKEDGATQHVRLAKRDGTVALGFSGGAAAEARAGGYDVDVAVFDAYAGATRIGGAAAQSSDGSDSSSDDGEDGGGRRGAASRKRWRTVEPHSAAAAPVQSDAFYQELFAATGGARLGMRARRAQPGKLVRAEVGAEGADASVADAAVAESGAAKKRGRNAAVVAAAAAASAYGREAETEEVIAWAEPADRNADAGPGDANAEPGDTDSAEADARRRKRERKALRRARKEASSLVAGVEAEAER